MIATLAKGLTGSESLASRSVMSPPIEGSIAAWHRSTVPNLNIDGGVGLPASERKDLPVVLLPLLKECGTGAQNIAEAVYSLQQASLEFRIVVVTDADYFKQLRSYGWAISHIEGEATYTGGSWRDYARLEMNRIIEAFSCVMVISVSEQGISGLSWKQLVQLTKLPIELANTSGHSPTGSLVSSHSSWRGWLNRVPSGTSQHTVQDEDAKWSMEITRQPLSSMVYVQLRIGEDEVSLPDGIAPSGWNVVRINSPYRSTVGSGECLRGVLAVFDGLSLANTGIVDCAHHAGLGLDSLPSTVIRTNGICAADEEQAYMRALARWSSM